MKISFLTIPLLLLCLGFPAQAQVALPMAIIPAPNNIKPLPGTFVFSQSTTIYVDQDVVPTANVLLTYLKSSRQYANKVVFYKGLAPKVTNALVIQQAKPGQLPVEGYALSVTKTQIRISGRGAGLFYGIQTFFQLLPATNSGSYQFNCMEINDQPRFAYRSLMLDVARHFFTVAEVKQVIDLMASFKLNTFHWHLVDNEGWRIEVKKYPKLTSVGGFRSEQVMFGRPELLDNKPYGGFYTQEQIKDVVKYAADRHITIIPEIEMPAHSVAALRAYPEYKPVRPEKSKDPVAYEYIFSPTEETFQFLENILAEVMPLFPGKYIHIGGDEANKVPWEESAFTQQLMKQQNLANVHDLQSYFFKRMEKYINSNGKAIIGWDEILEGGIAPNATIMSWRGEEGGIASAKQGHDVIMTPSTRGLYLDYSQSGSAQEAYSIGGYGPIERTYAYDPVPAELTESEKKYIKGVQGNLWTEFIPTIAKVQYMLFPRVLALAEIAWTNTERKNKANFFGHSMPVNLGKLENKGILFKVPEAMSPLDTTMIGERFNLELKAPIPGSRIYYSINGLNPLEIDQQYFAPLSIYVPANEKRTLKTIVITKTGRRSLVTTTVLHNRQPNKAAEVRHSKQGLNFKLSKGNFDTVDRIAGTAVSLSGIAPNLDLENFHQTQGLFGVIYEGYVNVPATGNYSFTATADDGMKLFIDDELVIDNDFKHPPTVQRGSVPLAAGLHKIRIQYFDAGEAYVLKLSYRLENGQETELRAESLFHNAE